MKIQLPKWEYEVKNLVIANMVDEENQSQILQDILNRMGSKGWELVSIHQDSERLKFGIFKRLGESIDNKNIGE